MDNESERSRQLQCWDGPTILAGFVNQWSSSQPTPDFEPDLGFCDALIDIGFNKCPDEVREFWRTAIKSNYRGDEGRRRMRMAAVNLAERGSLHLRLSDVQCPVMWLHVRRSLSTLSVMWSSILTAIGHRRCRVFHGKCQRRDRNVYRLTGRVLGRHRRRSAFPEPCPRVRS